MKNAVLILGILLVGFQGLAKEEVEIPAGASVEFTYAEFEKYDVKLINRSANQVNVSVLDPETRKQVSGFGLAPAGKAVLNVAAGRILKLTNPSSRDSRLTLEFVERTPETENRTQRETVSFTLRNSSLKSIPLIIPGVMNPNLSPLSNSGVTLEVGQKIYYQKGLKKVLILTVDKSLEDGAKVDVTKLIKKVE